MIIGSARETARCVGFRARSLIMPPGEVFAGGADVARFAPGPRPLVPGPESRMRQGGGPGRIDVVVLELLYA
jgi:hypothetical protein